MRQKSNGVVNPHWFKVDPSIHLFTSVWIWIWIQIQRAKHADPNFHVNADPDPNPEWHQNNADPCADYPKFYTC
jgi:hypothetical protein